MPESPTLHTGDIHDDDAAVFESFVSEHNEPPTPQEALISAGANADVYDQPRARVTRFITGSIALDPLWLPFQALPEDPNRIALNITVQTTVATDYILVSDDPGQLQTAFGAGRLYPNDDPSMFTGHTGRVVISALGASAAVIVSWWAVTK